jgi:hypothetical protein
LDTDLRRSSLTDRHSAWRIEQSRLFLISSLPDAE